MRCKALLDGVYVLCGFLACMYILHNLVIRFNSILSSPTSASDHHVVIVDSFNRSNPSVGKGDTMASRDAATGKESSKHPLNVTKKVLAEEDVIEDNNTFCPLQPPNLVGPLRVDLLSHSEADLDAEINSTYIKEGGHYQPPDCLSRSRIAIIIPYRNRTTQLNMFLFHMHPILQRQMLDYTIYIVEQDGDDKFNRALLLNIGFAEAVKEYDWLCFIFHDVDILPENDYNMYSCPEMPRHMSGYIDKFHYKLPYETIFGGITAFSRKHFELVNGFSNIYYGWGGEDDDLAARLKHHHLKFTRYDRSISANKMWKHKNEKNNKANPQRFALLKKASERMSYDGLNSLSYKLVKKSHRKYYTNLLVSFDEKSTSAAVFKKKKELSGRRR